MAPSPKSETNNPAQLIIEIARGGTLHIPCNEGLTFAVASLDDAADLLHTSMDALNAHGLSDSSLPGTIHTALSRVREAYDALQQLNAISQLKK